MKITHIIYALNTGGAETMLVDILNEQVKNHLVTLFVVNNKLNQAILTKINKKVNIVLLNRMEKSKSLLPFIKLNLKLFLNRPDVIHCHQHSLAKVIAFREKIFLTAHCLNIPTDYLKLYKKIFSISNAVKDDIEARSNIISYVVHNGINTSEIGTRVSNSSNKFRIIQVGRLDHANKGQHLLLQALHILVMVKEVKNIFVDFIGEGESQAFLEELVTKLEIDNHVRFLGLRDRNYIYSNLKYYDLLVQPSLYEGFGLTIVEAMAAKVPVLVSNIDGPMEVILNGELGSSFESDNRVDLANKIHNSIHNLNPDRIERAYNYTLNNYEVPIMIAKYNNLYSK